MLLHYSEQTSCILSRVSPAPAPRLVLRDNSAFFSMVKECMCLFVRFCWRCVALHILTHPLQQHDPVMYCVYTFWCLHIHHLLNSDKHTHDMCQNWLRGLSFFCFVQRDVSYGSHSKQQVFYSTWGWGPRPPSFTLSLLWAHCSVLGKANKQNEMLFSSCSPLGAMDFMIFVSLEKKKNPISSEKLMNCAADRPAVSEHSDSHDRVLPRLAWTEQMDASNVLCCWKCSVCWTAEHLVAFCHVLISKCVCDLRSRWMYITSYAAHLLWTSMESVQISGCVRNSKLAC